MVPWGKSPPVIEPRVSPLNQLVGETEVISLMLHTYYLTSDHLLANKEFKRTKINQLKDTVEKTDEQIGSLGREKETI